MDKIRFILALWIAKISVIALKITHHKGTDFPGQIAIKVCPNFMKYAAKPEKIIGVTGTNGKTTCANMVADMLKADGYKVLSNSAGSNTVTGIATCLIKGMNIFGKGKYHVASFEIDERSARLVYPHMTPEYVLLTNLSRDSIMRNGHPEFIGGILTRYMPKTTKMLINGDDLISVNICPENARAYFGIDHLDTDTKSSSNRINDIRICPKCQHALTYDFVRYSHIGKAKCTNCDYKSPEINYLGTNVDKVNMTVQMKDEGGCGTYKLLNDSIYNIYNVVSIVALFREMGYEHEKIEKLMEAVSIVESRLSNNKYGSREVMGLMAKDRNAFGTSRALEYVTSIPGAKEVVLMNNNLDDAIAWSENSCWLYDCDFELLDNDDVKNILLCGPRRYDYKLRLLMAGIPEEKITLVDDEKKTPLYLQLFENDKIYVLYGTALSQDVGMATLELIRQKLKSLAEEEKRGQAN